MFPDGARNARAPSRDRRGTATLADMTTRSTPPRPGSLRCPNTPPCAHSSLFHDVEDDEDTVPRCCAEDCPCGAERPPANLPNPEPGRWGVATLTDMDTTTMGFDERLAAFNELDALTEQAAEALAAVLASPVLSEHRRPPLHEAWQLMEMDSTCGDCGEGRCHWGGATKDESIAAAKAGQDYVHPHEGRCGCARHDASVRGRERRFRVSAAVARTGEAVDVPRG
jgi:uncharacterized low-complexity protein